MNKKQRVIYKTTALVIGSWLFANYVYWAMHQPQYSWVFDVNASALGVIWAIGLGVIFISLMVESDAV